MNVELMKRMIDGDNRPVVNPFTDNGKQSALGVI